MGQKIWAIDLDGVITANPQALSWLTYHLMKNENSDQVYVVSWRDGSNSIRKDETVADLQRFGICYDELIMAPKKFPNARVAAFWKIAQINKLKATIWVDDEIKIYERDYGINVRKLLPNVHIISI